MINYNELKVNAYDRPVIYDTGVINLVTVARLSKEKGLTRFMSAIRHMLDAGYKVVWHIIGEGAYRKEVEEKINEYHLRDNVILHGAKVNPYRYLVNADLFVLPSYEEAEGMVMKEALTLGLPVLATDTGATKDIVDERYGIVCDNTDAALEKSLYKILSSDKILEVMKKALSETYRPENSSNLERLINIIEAEVDTRKA